MNTISHMNVVVQQSGGAKEVHNVRHATQDGTQVVAAQQKEKADEQRTMVQHSEDARRAGFEKDLPDRRGRRRKRSPAPPKADTAEQQAPDSAGRLLDTVA